MRGGFKGDVGDEWIENEFILHSSILISRSTLQEMKRLVNLNLKVHTALAEARDTSHRIDKGIKFDNRFHNVYLFNAQNSYKRRWSCFHGIELFSILIEKSKYNSILIELSSVLFSKLFLIFSPQNINQFEIALITTRN